MITVTLYSNPFSSVAIAECPSYLGVCALMSVCLRGWGIWVWVCACRRMWEGAAVLFNLLTPQWESVGCKELSGQDLAP